MKLDFGLTGKSNAESQNSDVQHLVDEAAETNEPVTVDSFVNVPIDGVPKNGGDGGESGRQRKAPASSQRRTMDWLLLRRITLVQMTLAVIAMLCITVVVLASKMGRMLVWYKTAMFMWVIFLVITAYSGQKSGPKNYSNVVAYFVMSLFQTMVNGFWMAGIFMAVCYSMVMHGQDLEVTEYQSQWVRTGLIALELVESFAVLGTVFTGLLGVVVCCRGFGRLLQHQDEAIMAQSTRSDRY